MSRIKVCVIGIPRGLSYYSGESTRILNLAQNIRLNGCDVHLMVPDFPSGKVLSFPLLEGLHIHSFKGLIPTLYASLLPQHIASLARLHRQEGFDVIYANLLWGGFAAMVAKRFLRVPVVFDPHDWFFLSALGLQSFGDILERRIAATAESLVITGTCLRQFLMRRGVGPEKIRTISNGVERQFAMEGVDNSRVNAIRNLIGATENVPVVVYVGAMLPYKGLRILLKAAREYSTLGVRTILVGDGPILKELQNYSFGSGLGKYVHFFRHVSRDQLRHIIDSSSIGIVCTLETPYGAFNQPLKVFEYFARSKPVIASKLPGTSEIVKDSVNGVVVPPGDPKSIAAAIRDLISDDEKCRNYGREGRRIVLKEFTWDKLSLKLLKTLEQVAGQR